MVSDSQESANDGSAWPRSALAVAGVIAAVIIVYGGYGHHWPWTGINGTTATLWDWLHLLLLPLAVGVLPVWLRRRDQLGPAHRMTGWGVLAAFALLVLVGYTIPWAWTGFSGNKLWDWLELLALPVAIALVPVVREWHVTWSRRHWLILVAGLTLFGAVVLGGYVGGWEWTGFKGNTLWDWLHLLLLPLLVPTIAVPALMPMATAGLAEPEGDAEATSPEGVDDKDVQAAQNNK